MASTTIVEQIYRATQDFVASVDKKQRKRYGQFITPQTVAEYMASLCTIDLRRDTLRILDAGAGSGVLAAAAVCHIRACGFTGKIDVVCYENDTQITPLLKCNMQLLKSVHNINYELRCENYLLSQNFIRKDLFKNDIEPFDLVIGNPPYLKIAREAPEATAMAEICHGAPNLYFLFWAMGIHNLADNGELIYIVPRSWTSGAYFESFRKYLFQTCVITDIHLFESRDKVFDNESVLQETIIVKIRKTLARPQYINITSSATSDLSNLKKHRIDYTTIVANNGYVFLVTDPKDAEILSRVNRQSSTLDSDGLRMHTGLIVDYRNREILRKNASLNTYPLFYSYHITKGQVQWPIGRESEYIETDRIGFLMENCDYLFVKRFTSKEEKRRLQCGLYLCADYKEYKYISTQNKINYIKCDNVNVAYGLYVIFNSTLYDQYYRILNGSTQVNATEINLMPVPSYDIIAQMGSEIKKGSMTETECNNIIDKWIR